MNIRNFNSCFTIFVILCQMATICEGGVCLFHRNKNMYIYTTLKSVSECKTLLNIASLKCLISIVECINLSLVLRSSLEHVAADTESAVIHDLHKAEDAEAHEQSQKPSAVGCNQYNATL